MNVRCATLAAALMLVHMLSTGAVQTVEHSKADSDKQREYLVGVHYFAGWWRELPNKYHSAGHDWRPDYPDRIPLLGEYNEQETMDREIIAAADHEVDFFQILWYPQDDQAPPAPHREKLNEGVRLFMASPNNHRMKFTVEFVNHPPFAITTDDGWKAACREWCAAMKHPSYLRVSGRPVFKVHSLHALFEQNGNDQTQVARRLETLRRMAKENGLPNPLLGGGVMAAGVPAAASTAPYDFLATYMGMPNLPKRDQPYPYAELLNYAQEAWQRYAATSEKSYVPYLPAGWDPRPWKDRRPSFELPTRDDWTDALLRVEAALDESPKLGIPMEDGTRQKMLLIYAWNEFGEGGIVAPIKGDAYMKLEAIKAVFGGPQSAK